MPTLPPALPGVQTRIAFFVSHPLISQSAASRRRERMQSLDTGMRKGHLEVSPEGGALGRAWPGLPAGWSCCRGLFESDSETGLF